MSDHKTPKKRALFVQKWLDLSFEDEKDLFAPLHARGHRLLTTAERALGSARLMTSLWESIRKTFFGHEEDVVLQHTAGRHQDLTPPNVRELTPS